MAPSARASVRTKLILASLLSSGAALLLAGTAITGYDMLALREKLARRMTIQADIVGANCLSALLFSDPKSAETTLAGLKADPRVLAAGIYTADRRLFSAYLRETPQGRGLLGETLHEGGGGIDWRDGRLLVSRDVLFDGKPIGAAVIVSDLGDINASLTRDVVIFASVLIASLLLALAISSRLQREISQPIVALAETARRISAEKDYSVRAAAGSRDEIGELVTAFNEMLDEIRQQQQALRAAHDGLEQRVAERTTELQAANQELEAFSYSVSHDLRAPVRHIAGFAEILATECPGLDESGRTTLGKISRAAARMGQLIDDLLVFCRMARSEMQREPVSLSDLLAEVIQEAQPDLKRPIEWRIGSLPSVSGDRAMLRLVLTNLVANALKYTGKTPQPRIEVDIAGEEGREVVLRVRDNGVGFDMAHASKLFGVFQRLHRADEFPGTGIGLANVRRIVHRHGGRTWAEATPGRGAAFYISLPKLREAAA